MGDISTCLNEVLADLRACSEGEICESGPRCMLRDVKLVLALLMFVLKLEIRLSLDVEKLVFALFVPVTIEVVPGRADRTNEASTAAFRSGSGACTLVCTLEWMGEGSPRGTLFRGIRSKVIS